MRSLKTWAIWILIAIGAFAVGRYFLGSETATGSFDRSGPVAVHHIILLVVFLGALIAARPSMGEVGRAVLLWGGLAAVLVAGYAYRGELQAVGLRTLAALVPGMVVSEPGGGGSVSVVRSGDNHFRLSATVNSATVPFMVDTGASVVTLTAADARRAGYDLGSLNFSVPVSTANGRTVVAPVTLDRLAVGDFRVDGLDGFVAQPGQLGQSLLGMNFLDTLSSWHVRGDRLVLTP